MFYGIKDKLKRLKFDFQVRDVLRTPPARISPGSPAVILSQLQHKDLRMFLLASKSFMEQVPVAHVYILDDGSLTADDRAILAEHIPKLDFLVLNDFRSSVCPAGACWERLLSIAEMVKNHYVIQLDGDTLTVGDISEIRANVDNGFAFTLGTWDNQIIQSMRECCEATQAKVVADPNPHVQYVAETNFDKLKQYDSLQYVKGCAGFTGAPRGAFTREFIEEISSEMEAAIGGKWRQWGSEQVMSNIVIANIPGAVVLPHPKYSSCENLKNGQPAFLHFIGSYRFDNGDYARIGRHIIQRLGAQKIAKRALA